MASRSIFSSQLSRNYQGLARAGALVNLRARRFRRGSFRTRNAGANVRDKLTNRCRHSLDAYKASCGCGRADWVVERLKSAAPSIRLLELCFYGRPWQMGPQDTMLRKNEEGGAGGYSYR